MAFIGTFARTLKGVAGGFLRGGPLGALKGGATALIKRPQTLTGVVGRPGIAPRFPFGPNGGKQGPDLPPGWPGGVPEPGLRGGIQRFLPGGQTGYTGAPPGYHVNKVYLSYLRAQQTGRPMQDPFSEPRAKNVIVKNRKLNPLNPRALRRANARQVGAVRMMRRVLRGSGYTIARPRFGGKKARRR